MKYFITFLLTLFLINISYAQTLTDSFNNKQISKVTVSEVFDMEDEKRVSLVGQIINVLGDDKYIFKDQTGEVIVEIDDEDLQGKKFTTENTIEITGIIDKEFSDSMQIDVDSFSVKK